MKFYIETYGCTSNLGNSQDLARALLELGHTLTTPDEADAVIVNTCAVTERTQRKILRRLDLLQGKQLIIGGCLPVAIPESINRIKCRGSLGLLGRSAAARVEDIFNDELDVEPSKYRTAHPSRALQRAMEKRSEPSSMPGYDPCVVVNVAEGCNGSCTYCIVRTARGELKSRDVEEVAAEMELLVSSGAVEVQLSAQDTAAYGRDIGTDLGKLLCRLVEVPGDFKMRMGMMNPKSAGDISCELIRALKSEKIYRFLHIPVQSGSDRILESMGRRYRAQDFLNVVSLFRSTYPDITIITDVIAGFPGETQSDFKETMNIIDLMAPDKVNVTRFSARPGTAASKLYDMPDRIKKERSRELTRVWLQTAEKRNKRYLGEILNARVTEDGRGDTMKARADNYLGIVVKGRPRLGSSIKVLVEGCNAFYVSGRAVGRAVATKPF
jgi:MiaB-like tRNA modifying enzyme